MLEWKVECLMKKRVSKLLSLFLALTMVSALFVPALAADEEAVKPYEIPDVNGKVVVLHTNDTHGGDMAEEGTSIGTAGVAQLKKDLEAAGADVILLSAGDATQGAPIVNFSQGAAAIRFMNAAGYDAMAPGNHEFDWGAENLQTIVKDAEFPILAANILGEDGKPLFGSNTIFTTKSGLKIGVFGLDTPEAATKTNPEKIKGLSFLAGEELYACAQAQVDELKAAGCEFIIALGHLGVDEETAATFNRSVDVVNHVTGIDLFVDGHSHTVMEDGKPVKAETYPSFNNESETLIVSTGTKLAYVGAVIYDPADKSLTPSLISAAAYTKTDADVAKLVSDVNAEVDEALKEVIGKTEVVLNGERAPGNRTQETNLGDFTTDALLWFAKKDQGDHVVAAITNGGGIRAEIPAGNISMKTMNTVFPFGNTVVTLTLTGQQLLETLEAATYCTPTPIGAFPQVAGIEFTINTAVPYQNGEAYGTYFRCANPGERVTDVKVAGQPLDLNASYTVATNDFSAVGGDTYYAFKDAKATMIDTGIPLDQALSDYANEVLGGNITAAQYGQSAGRITINRMPKDVTTDAWYADAVVNALEKNFLTGTGHGYFAPMGEVTRATLFQILYNMEEKPEAAAAIADVAGKWYADAVDWAASAGLFTGTSFGADAVITRAEVAKILADYAAYKGITVDTAGMAMKEAPDYETIPAEYLEGMTFCYYAGLMTGDQAHRLNPGSSLTRAELAQMLVRFAELEVPAADADKAA